ncbi:protein of unknown function [Rhodovastum atsumiense]|nr:protein of unknown function [Rhodovastum atsumiense]
MAGMVGWDGRFKRHAGYLRGERMWAGPDKRHRAAHDV